MAVSRKTGELYFTDEEKEAALQNNNALEYALSRGYHLIQMGNEFHLKEHDSMVFTRDGRWFWNSQGIKGRAIDFIMKYEDQDYITAICTLAGTMGRPMPIGPPRQISSLPPPEKREFILPERAENNRIVFAYLIKERGIDPALVRRMAAEKKIYQCVTYSKLEIAGYTKDGKACYTVKKKYEEELADLSFAKMTISNNTAGQSFHEEKCLSPDEIPKLLKSGQIHQFQSLVMVGYDESGEAQYASQRSTNMVGKAFKVDISGSDKSYPFLLIPKQGSDTVCVFESPIEAMSYWTLCYETGSPRLNSYMLSQGGAGTNLSLERFLSGHSEIRHIIAALNNDSRDFDHTINAGKNGIDKICRKFGEEYDVSIHQPHLNDWNDVLKNYRKNHLAARMKELRRPPPVQAKTMRQEPER